MLMAYQKEGSMSLKEVERANFILVKNSFSTFIMSDDAAGGRKEDVHFDKITSRIQKLCYGLNTDFVDPVSCRVFSYFLSISSFLTTSYFQIEIAMKVIRGLFPGVTTMELDNLAAEIAASMTTRHPDYAVLAARIAVSNLHKETKKTFTGKF